MFSYYLLFDLSSLRIINFLSLPIYFFYFFSLSGCNGINKMQLCLCVCASKKRGRCVSFSTPPRLYLSHSLLLLVWKSIYSRWGALFNGHIITKSLHLNLRYNFGNYVAVEKVTRKEVRLGRTEKKGGVVSVSVFYSNSTKVWMIYYGSQDLFL